MSPKRHRSIDFIKGVQRDSRKAISVKRDMQLARKKKPSTAINSIDDAVAIYTKMERKTWRATLKSEDANIVMPNWIVNLQNKRIA